MEAGRNIRSRPAQPQVRPNSMIADQDRFSRKIASVMVSLNPTNSTAAYAEIRKQQLRC
jgi:hypothetical protein